MNFHGYARGNGTLNLIDVNKIYEILNINFSVYSRENQLLVNPVDKMTESRYPKLDAPESNSNSNVFSSKFSSSRG